MNVMNLTPEQLVKLGVTAVPTRGPDGRHDTGVTVTIAVKGQAGEEIGDFWAEAIVARLKNPYYRKSCPQHSGRDMHPYDYKTCTCAWALCSQIEAALAVIKNNVNARKAA